MKIREIPGYPGYAASRDGGIWSKKIPGSGRIGVKWRRLSGKEDDRGYRKVALYCDDGRRDWFVHQLILLTFVGPMPDGQETRHLNNVRDDNRLDNLCYGTRQRNAQDAVECGSQPHGESHGRSKLTEEQAKEIIRLRAEEGIMACKLAEMFSVSEPLVSLILNGKAWKHLSRPEEFVKRQMGLKTPAAKITEDQVREIRKLYNEGWTQPDLAKKYEVSQTCISHIVTGKSWSHVV